LRILRPVFGDSNPTVAAFGRSRHLTDASDERVRIIVGMLGTNWRVQLLSVAGVVEGITALGLMIVPRVAVWLLFGADIDATAVALARVAGIALFSLSLGCWMGRQSYAVIKGSRALRHSFNSLKLGTFQYKSPKLHKNTALNE
jgi:hypothetical protein